jgi:hypothetical protein
VLRIQIRDPVWVKKSRSGTEMNIRLIFLRAKSTVLKVLMRIRIRDPESGMAKFGPQHCFQLLPLFDALFFAFFKVDRLKNLLIWAQSLEIWFSSTLLKSQRPKYTSVSFKIDFYRDISKESKISIDFLYLMFRYVSIILFFIKLCNL